MQAFTSVQKLNPHLFVCSSTQIYAKQQIRANFLYLQKNATYIVGDTFESLNRYLLII